MSEIWASVAEYGFMYNLFLWLMMAVGWFLQDFPGIIGMVIIPDLFMNIFWLYRTYHIRFSHIGKVINGDYCKKYVEEFDYWF